MAELEALGQKKLRSFALFPAKKRQKYEAAYGLFGGAAKEYLTQRRYEKAGECIRQQARLAINKLQRPVESAAHYMEATRAYMLAGELESAFECLQLAVSARTKPTVKHKENNLELSVSGITVTEGRPPLAPSMTHTTDASFFSPETRPMASSMDAIKQFSPSSTSHQLRPLAAMTRSPALTSQAGRISIEGPRLYLSPETMQAPISSQPASRSFQLNTQPTSSGPSAGLFGHSTSSTTSSAAPSPPASPSSNPTTLPTRQRRHSLSGSANSSNVTVEGIVHEVLHLDLLIARLAVQLAADLWTDLDFRDAILSLEIASSLFATLLIAERNFGSFRKKTKKIVAPLLPVIDPPLKRAESASSPNTPQKSPSKPPTLKTTDEIESRLADLLGPSAFSTKMSSQTVSGATLVSSQTTTFSSKPLQHRPIPTIAAEDAPTDDPQSLVLHTADPHLSVGEGEGYFSDTVGSDPGVSILEESLVCRFQLANYYATYDEELGDADRSPENQELRRAKALFEQVASQKPDEALIHATLLPLLTEELEATPAIIDEVTTLISVYAADDDKLHQCLFLAGLCDALIGIRVYQASQVKILPPAPSLIDANGKKIKDKKNKSKSLLPPTQLPPPPVPDLYLMARTVYCPPILLRYREISASFGVTSEIRFLRACNGLLQMAANLPARLNEAFGGTAPNAAKQLFQAAWGAEILREFTEVVAVYNQQRPLTSIVAKLLFSIKKAIKSTIAMK